MGEVEKRTVINRNNEPIKVLSVKKSGKTSLTLEDGSRWRTRDGKEYGSHSWGIVQTIREYRPGDEARIKYLQAIETATHRLNAINWRRLPLMTLEQILAIVEAAK